jgi:heat shock protein HslJ
MSPPEPEADVRRLARVMRRPPRPAAFLVIAFLFALAGCDSDDSAPPPSGARPASLAGTSWVVVAVDGQAPVAGGEPSLTFSDDRVSGSGGCNRLGGAYRYDGSTGQLEFSNLAMTAMGCLDDRRNRVEAAFSKALGGPMRAHLDAEQHLVLEGPGGTIVLAARVNG